MNIDLENSTLITKADKVRKLCAPLRSIGISDFFFMRVFKDNTIIDLATHQEWGKHFFINVYQEIYDKSEIQNHFFPSNYINLWEHYPENTIWQEGKNHFEVGNGISILKKHNDYHDIFSFFTDKNNFKLNEFYINNLDLLEKFIVYFKEQAKDLIHKSNQSRLIIPSNYSLDIADNYSESEQKIEIFLKEIQTDKNDNQFQQLSKRECECLYWIALGKSAEEVGYILGCSKRTVEFHINNARTKTNTSKVTMLIYQATKSGMI